MSSFIIYKMGIFRLLKKKKKMKEESSEILQQNARIKSFAAWII